MSVVLDHSAGAADQLLVDRILALVRERAGADFTLYRPATVRRRIGNRMIAVGTATLDDYLAYLESNRGEAQSLLGHLTIKVSRFYRNPATFDHLRASVLPDLARAGRPLRVWSVGCGRGEEAYTLGMLMEQAGIEGVVHATDIDPDALGLAAAAVYGPDALDDLPCELAALYLQPQRHPAGPRYRVCRSVRRRVIFSRHDITRDDTLPGGACFDLVAFRNVSIYLKRETHERTFLRVADALCPGGYLCLGEAEWPPAAVERRLECGPRRLRVFRARHIEALAA